MTFRIAAAFAGGWGTRTPGVALGIGVDPDHRLPVEVLGDVGDQAVLAHHHDHVVRREEEAREVGALHGPAPPVQRNAAGHRHHRRLLGLVPRLHLGDVPAAGAEEEGCLPAGAVAGKQLGHLGAAVDHDRPGWEAHAGVPVTGSVAASKPPPSRASTGASRSGVRTRLLIWGRLAASSLTRFANEFSTL